MDRCKDKKIKKNYSKGIQQYLESIIACMPGNVYWMDNDSVYQGCNDNVANMLNLKSRYDIVGMTYDQIAEAAGWDKNLVKSFRKTDLTVLQTGTPTINVEEPPIVYPDGRVVYFLTNRVPIKDENGAVVGIVGISVDITDRKKMEEDLRIAKDKAESANYFKVELISNMGHDLVTPFSEVSAAISMLDYETPGTPEFNECITLLKDRCQVWEGVFSRVINTTAISEFDIKLESFSILDELQLIIDKLTAKIEAKNLKFIIEESESSKEYIIETDRLNFREILYSLIENAINFTEKGLVSVSILKERGWFKIRITDTGIGIPADMFGYIFQQYTKLARSNKCGSFKGIGAGLYLAEKRADIVGASIHVESELGKGSTFTLSIPAHPIKKT